VADRLARAIWEMSALMSSADIDETPIRDGSLFAKLERRMRTLLTDPDLVGRGDDRLTALAEVYGDLVARSDDPTGAGKDALFTTLWQALDEIAKTPARRFAMTTLVVPDYDAAIAFFCRKVGFALIEDSDLGDGKRWVVLGLPGGGARLLIARAATPGQAEAIGRQTGGRVGFFLETDDIARDHAAMLAAGVIFEDPPRRDPYGWVAVWRDPYGNRWDLIEPAEV